VTLADGAGYVLIGLTVRPDEPGPNIVLIHVLPLEVPAAAADVQVRIVHQWPRPTSGLLLAQLPHSGRDARGR
jgi:hypothetical protein